MWAQGSSLCRIESGMRNEEKTDWKLGDLGEEGLALPGLPYSRIIRNPRILSSNLTSQAF